MTNFWDKVNITQDETECWEWLGQYAQAGRQGYGRFIERGKRIAAHRRAYELANNCIIGPNQEIRHTCDNPKCCNPNHLIVGTHAENMADKRRRGFGSAPQKLTEQQVLEIYQLHSNGTTGYKLAQMFNVSVMNISCIVNGKSWRHLYPVYQEMQAFARPD